MIDKDQLHEAFGELLYAVAMADGKVQTEERERLELLLKEFEGAREVLWSFNYETGRKRPVSEAYERALDACAEFGPYDRYPQFFSMLEAVAEASAGIDAQERELIDSFQADLLSRFRADPTL